MGGLASAQRVCILWRGKKSTINHNGMLMSSTFHSHVYGSLPTGSAPIEIVRFVFAQLLRDRGPMGSVCRYGRLVRACTIAHAACRTSMSLA